MEGATTSGSSTAGLAHEIAKPSWKFRRIVIFATLILDAITIATILTGWLYGLDTNAGIAVIAGSVFAQSTAIIGSYVFGAAWENVGAMKHLDLSSVTHMIGDIKDVQGTRNTL